MARHRAPRSTVATVTVPGLVAVAAGLVLLLAPAAPIAARSGSVLDGPAATPSPASSTSPTWPTSSPAAGEGQGTRGTGSGPVAGTAVPLVPDAPRALPLPVLVGFVPDRLVVDALDVDAPLRTTLVDASGAFVPPDDPAELGWWRGVRPGTGAGSVVVAGHIDSTRFGQGPLARLVDLSPGDRAVLSGPDGGRAEYVVRGIQTFPKDALPAGDLFRTDGAERLVLVTCGGRFDREQGSWDSNIVAVLDRVPAG